MATLSPAQLYALARNAGLSPSAATTATAVALAESGGRTDAVGDVSLEDATWGPSVGPWQIRSIKAQTGTGGPRDVNRLTDPGFNAASMASISGGGKNFSPWTTYAKGTYKQYVSQVSSAASADTASKGTSWLTTILAGIGLGAGTVTGGVGTGVQGAATGAQAGQAVSSLLDGWQAGAVKILGGVAAAALVILGAVHTISDK